MRGEISTLEEENKVVHFPKFMPSLKPWNKTREILRELNIITSNKV